MALREMFVRILTDYPQAKTAPLEGHALAQFIRGEAAATVSDALGALSVGLVVEGRSVGTVALKFPKKRAWPPSHARPLLPKRWRPHSHNKLWPLGGRKAVTITNSLNCCG